MGTIAVVVRVTGEAEGPVGFATVPTDVIRHWSFQAAVVGAASITPDQVHRAARVQGLPRGQQGRVAREADVPG